MTERFVVALETMLTLSVSSGVTSAAVLCKLPLGGALPVRVRRWLSKVLALAVVVPWYRSVRCCGGTRQRWLLVGGRAGCSARSFCLWSWGYLCPAWRLLVYWKVLTGVTP